ncbi:MAG: hypothetical protein EOP51_24000, partial [Sphingobacteriales bacterium]
MMKGLRLNGVAGGDGIDNGSNSIFNRFLGTVLLFVMMMSSGVYGQINEDFSTGLRTSGYAGNGTNTGNLTLGSGAWIFVNSGLANNTTGNAGVATPSCQMQSGTNNSATLPTLNTVGTISFCFKGGTPTLSKTVGGVTTTITLTKTGNIYSATINDASSSIVLKINNSAATSYLDDVSTTSYSAAPCSGTPNAGTTTVSSTGAGAGSTYTVSSTGHSTAATGLTYQWQSNTNSAGWVNVGTASSTYADYSATAPGTVGTIVQWRLSATCSNSSITSTSTAVSFTVTNPYNMPAGTNSVTTCSMTVYDSGGPSGNYSNNANSILTINPATPGSLIQVSGTFDLENTFDYLYVYDGSSIAGTLLGTYTGSGSIPALQSSTGPITLRFTSDNTTIRSGFQINVSCTVPTYTLTYNGNGNTGGTVPTAGPYQEAATVTVLGNTGSLVKTNYNFSGWNTAAAGTGTDRAAASTFSMPASNTILYAKWTGNVSYDANGGTGTVTDATNYLAGQSVTTASGAGFTRAGYAFIGWNTLANGLGTSYTASQVSAFNFAGNTTLYAVWNPVGSHTAIFEANGGTGTMANQVESSAAALTTNAFTRTGYTFANWNTAANGSGTTYTNGQSYSFASNITLYAQWTPNNNTVTFDANTGTGTMSSQTIATAATVALNANTFTKAGYTFTGWATTAGGAVAYANSASYTMGTSNVTLYAKWTANNNTIT